MALSKKMLIIGSLVFLLIVIVSVVVVSSSSSQSSVMIPTRTTPQSGTIPPMVPITSPPTTMAPTTRAPTTMAPTTMAPTTMAPTTRAPTTMAPTTMAPTTMAPTTMAPTTVPPTMSPTTIDASLYEMYGGPIGPNGNGVIDIDKVVFVPLINQYVFVAKDSPYLKIVSQDNLQARYTTDTVFDPAKWNMYNVQQPGLYNIRPKASRFEMYGPSIGTPRTVSKVVFVPSLNQYVFMIGAGGWLKMVRQDNLEIRYTAGEDTVFDPAKWNNGYNVGNVGGYNVRVKMEVYQVPGGYDYKYSQAEGVCSRYGASVATSAQLSNAQSLGAEWCSAGWVSDSLTAQYPMQSSKPGCGDAGVNSYITATSANDTNTSASVNCFGTKPQGMKMFNESKYYS
jgi:hypothetical protein